ncbi:MAG: LapA family protein [Myxococcota bacterium]|nr:LapA family protein [Myxococcota bacterium]
MISQAPHPEQLRSDLTKLINKHRRTRTWFWRTGTASLVSAGLWIVIYTIASKEAGVKETLAIIVGAILMWILFLWAFFLLRKLNRLTAQVRRMEKQLIDVLIAKDSRSD